MAEYTPTTGDVRSGDAREEKAWGSLRAELGHWLAAHDAELRAEVERLRAEQERHALANDGCVPGAAYRDLAAAHADLRAGIFAAVTVLNREFYRRPATWVGRLAADLRALLAESGEQHRAHVATALADWLRGTDGPDTPVTVYEEEET